MAKFKYLGKTENNHFRISIFHSFTQVATFKYLGKTENNHFRNSIFHSFRQVVTFKTLGKRRKIQKKTKDSFQYFTLSDNRYMHHKPLRKYKIHFSISNFHCFRQLPHLDVLSISEYNYAHHFKISLVISRCFSENTEKPHKLIIHTLCP